jgi:hypothetical protein
VLFYPVGGGGKKVGVRMSFAPPLAPCPFNIVLLPVFIIVYAE